MGKAKESLNKIVKELNQNQKAQSVFVTNVAGKDENWDMSFQFKLDKEEFFYLNINNKLASLSDGINPDAKIVLTGRAEAILRICEGKGDFTHAISREQITVEKGKVMDVIRLTRAITIAIR